MFLHGPQDLCLDAWLEQLKTPLPTPSSVCISLIHITARPQIWDLFGNGTRVCAVKDTICSITNPHQQNLQIAIPTPLNACSSLINNGANLCMTNNPNLLVNIQACTPFVIALATLDGRQSQTNLCCQ
jgi:hypothetical protein